MPTLTAVRAATRKVVPSDSANACIAGGSAINIIGFADVSLLDGGESFIKKNRYKINLPIAIIGKMPDKWWCLRC